MSVKVKLTTPEGSYTPTATIVANVSAVVVATAHWVRVDNSVMVWGRIEIDPIAGGAGVAVRLSLPVPSNLGSEWDLAGNANNLSVTGNGLAVRADVGNDEAQIQGIVNTPNNMIYYYDYSYPVL